MFVSSCSRGGARRQKRSGKIVMLFALLCPALVGLLGLVIDGGLLMEAQRQAQNAADAGALAAAVDRLRGQSTSSATATANTFVKTHNGLGSATVAVNIPPSSGRYAGSSQHVEVIVSYPVYTLFIQAVGVNSSQSVTARAVAGFEAVSAGEGVAVLDPRARPGLSISGTGATLYVQGRVVANSMGLGYDENWVDLGAGSNAVDIGGGATLQAAWVQVYGGVNDPGKFRPLPGNTNNPLDADARLIEPDPLKNLPVPTAANLPSVSLEQRTSQSLTSPTPVTLQPGIYPDIFIGNNANVTFAPGIYILSPTAQNQGLRINGSPTVNGDGVMFYVTGSNYMQNGVAGYYDSLDGAVEMNVDGTLPAAPDQGSVTFATVDINANNATINLQGLKNSGSPFNGMLLFQRRRNENAVAIQGKARTNVTLGGTLYAKWAQFKVAGGGKYDAQFIAGSMAISGQGNVTIDYAGKNLGKANQIYLVE